MSHSTRSDALFLPFFLFFCFYFFQTRVHMRVGRFIYIYFFFILPFKFHVTLVVRQVNERTGRPLSKKEIRDMAKKTKKSGK